VEKAFDKAGAHDGLVAYPSEDAQKYCGSCHPTETNSFKNALHYTQEGYFERFKIRSGYDLRAAGHEEEMKGFKADCGKCHATCGQCHVSRPRSTMGGFISGQGHEFKKTPTLQENCTACHGSRVGEEYTGSHEGLQPDVHYYKYAKRCEFCHTGSEMHGGDGTPLTYRYSEENNSMPKCENCHVASKDDTANQYHQMHWAGNSGVTLACQVCHAQTYKNCNGCHAGKGITGSSYLTFEIGKNYLNQNKRYQDYDYITVRHIPVAPNTFEEWGISDLMNFESSEPTWKLTTPHNIQRWTPQTKPAEGATCSAACHNSDYYLREQDVEQYSTANGDAGYGFDDIARELTANKEVIISK
jgi:thiosulfate/3-mercaptopyruvate sulfurtransferase